MVRHGVSKPVSETVAVRASPVQRRRAGVGTIAASTALVRIFESEVDPFEFDLVGSAHFVLYRKVWRDGQRYIQGAVIEKTALLRELIETPYRDTALVGMSRLGIVFDEEILSALGGQQGRDYLSSTEELSGTLLYRGRLSSPLDQLELILSVSPDAIGYRRPPGDLGCADPGAGAEQRRCC